MKQYDSFIFEGYSWNHHAGKILLRYSLGGEIRFEETIFLPEAVSDERLKAKEWEIERALKALYMIGGISYYKTCLPKKIVIKEDILSKREAQFWNSVYEHGLGEFFYKNDIDFRGLINFPSGTPPETSEKKSYLRNQQPGTRTQQRILVPFGGGKDSVVSAELLKKHANVTLLRVGEHPFTDELADIAGLPLLNVKRALSPALFKLNEQGALNGHVPITAYISVLSILIALVYDFDAVAMSNERSANEGNVEFKGMEINHQWSKSIDFERAFRTFISDSMKNDVEYFSLLRPYSELKITELFSGMPHYFMHATSCNKNWKLLADKTRWPANRSAEREGWCGTCPKCAFVFACLAAFLPKKELTKIFGANLFENQALLPLYKELLGLQNFKPFECVGTQSETKAAFLLIKKKGEFKDSPVMKMFETEAFPKIKNPEALIENVMKNSDEHCIPKSYQNP